MSKKTAFVILKEAGFFEYGAVVESSLFRETFEIEEVIYPAQRVDIDRQALQELSCIDYVRNKLLNEGKYIKQERDSYRVLLPSENTGQVLSYMTSADNKLKRGIKLNTNTSAEFRISTNDEVRAIMKRESIKKETK